MIPKEVSLHVKLDIKKFIFEPKFSSRLIPQNKIKCALRVRQLISEKLYLQNCKQKAHTK